MAPAAAKHNLSLVPLASPTSGLERIQQAEPSGPGVVEVALDFSLWLCQNSY